MKKILLQLLLLISINTFAQTTYIPDDNFEQTLIDLGYDSGPLDDYVPTANINTITSLNLLNDNIDDLTGIENFVALTELNCGVNRLTELNVTQNIALEVLICNTNQLTYLDLSQNINLISLNFHFNQIAAIDLSKNVNLSSVRCRNNLLTNLNLTKQNKLTTLNCSFNQITDLDLSQNTNLNDLLCEDNQLINLNVKNGNNTNFTNFNALTNPDLSCINVDDIGYSTTNWLDIDATASFSQSCLLFTYTPDDNFEQALIDLGYDSGSLDNKVPTKNINTITSLIVNNKNISDLTGIEDFIALTLLNCSTNLLTDLNVTQNTNLNNLFCVTNQLTNIDVTQNKQLVNLNIVNNELTSLDLTQNEILTAISCGGNQLNSLNIKNGNNTNVFNFSASNNPSLTCITVDNVAYSTANWTTIDPASSFSEACSTLGIEDVFSTNESLLISNYGDSTIKIEATNNSIIKNLRVYNLLGELIISKKPNQSSFFIETSTIKQGTILFIKAELDNNQIINKKILKL